MVQLIRHMYMYTCSTGLCTIDKLRSCTVGQGSHEVPRPLRTTFNHMDSVHVYTRVDPCVDDTILLQILTYLDYIAYPSHHAKVPKVRSIGPQSL